MDFKIPIVALTAVETEDAKKRAFENGFNYYLVKPAAIGDIRKFFWSYSQNLLIISCLLSFNLCEFPLVMFKEINIKTFLEKSMDIPFWMSEPPMNFNRTYYASNKLSHFDTDERAVIGRTYKELGPDAAN